MPFKSEAQRRFMFSKHPEMAKEWEKDTPKDAELPERIHPEKNVKDYIKRHLRNNAAK